jgi:hypothetical protein
MSKTPSTGYRIAPVTHTRFCRGCDGLAVTTGECGPVSICDECAASLTAFICGEPGAVFRPELRFPLAGASPVSCENRRDLVKAERRHAWVYLGVDARHMGDGASGDLHVYACAECGRDRQTRKAPAS